MTQDRNDYVAAFAIGAIVGIGATLLLAPPATRRDRIMYEIGPTLKRVRKGSRHLRKQAREAVREFGKRGERVLDAAAHDVRRAARRRMGKARRAMRKFR